MVLLCSQNLQCAQDIAIYLFRDRRDALFTRYNATCSGSVGYLMGKMRCIWVCYITHDIEIDGQPGLGEACCKAHVSRR